VDLYSAYRLRKTSNATVVYSFHTFVCGMYIVYPLNWVMNTTWWF